MPNEVYLPTGNTFSLQFNTGDLPGAPGTRVQIRRRKITKRVVGGSLGDQYSESRYLNSTTGQPHPIAGITSVYTHNWSTSSSAEANFDSGGLLILASGWGSNNTVYSFQFRLRDGNSWTSWSDEIRIYANSTGFNSGLLPAVNVTSPEFGSQFTDNQGFVLRWNVPQGNPHHGFYRVKRTRVIPSQPSPNVRYWSNVSRRWGSDYVNDMTTSIAFAGGEWAETEEEVPGLIIYYFTIQYLTWDFRWSPATNPTSPSNNRAEIQRLDLTNYDPPEIPIDPPPSDPPPSDPPDDDDDEPEEPIDPPVNITIIPRTPTIVSPTGFEEREVERDLRITWEGERDSNNNPISIDKVRIKRTQLVYSAEAGGYISSGNIVWLTRSFPVAWSSSMTDVDPTDATHIVLGVGALQNRWGEPGVVYQFEMQVHRPDYVGVVNHYPWSLLSEPAIVTAVDNVAPLPPVLQPPVEIMDSYNNNDEITLRVSLPTNQLAKKIRLIRTPNLDSNVGAVYWDYDFYAVNRGAFHSTASDAWISPIAFGTGGTVNITLNGIWQPSSSTHYYYAYYQNSNDEWSGNSEKIALTTHAGPPNAPRLTWLSGRYNALQGVTLTYELDLAGAQVSSDFTHVRFRRRAQYYRYLLGIRTLIYGEYEYLTSATNPTWTTTEPTGNQYQIADTNRSVGVARGWANNITIDPDHRAFGDDPDVTYFMEAQVKRQAADDPPEGIWSSWNHTYRRHLRPYVPELAWNRIGDTTWTSISGYHTFEVSYNQTLRFNYRRTNLYTGQVGPVFIDRLAISRRQVNTNTVQWANISSGTLTWDGDTMGFAHTGGHVDLPANFQPNNTIYRYNVYYRSNNENWSEAAPSFNLNTSAALLSRPTWVTTAQSASFHQSIKLQWNTSQTLDHIQLRVVYTGHATGEVFLGPDSDRRTYQFTAVEIEHSGNEITLNPGWHSGVGTATFYLTYYVNGNESHESFGLTFTATDTNPARPRFTSPIASGATPTANPTTTSNPSEELSLRWEAPSEYNRVRMRRLYTPTIPAVDAQPVSTYLASERVVEFEIPESWVGTASAYVDSMRDHVLLSPGWAVPGQSYRYFVSYQYAWGDGVASAYKWSDESYGITVRASTDEAATLTNITDHTGSVFLVRYIENGNYVWGAMAEDFTRLQINADQRININSVISRDDPAPLFYRNEVIYVSSGRVLASNINTGAVRTLVDPPHQREITNIAFDSTGSFAYVSDQTHFDGPNAITFTRYNLPNFDGDHAFAIIASSSDEIDFVANQHYMYLQRGDRTYRVPTNQANLGITDAQHDFTIGSPRLRLMGVSNDYVYYADYDGVAPFIRRVPTSSPTNSSPVTILNDDPFSSVANHNKYFVATNSYVWTIRQRSTTLYGRRNLTGGNYTQQNPFVAAFDVDTVRWSPASPSDDGTAAEPEPEAVFLDRGMILYQREVLPGYYSELEPADLFGAIDHEGNDIELSAATREGLAAGVTIPQVIYGDIAYYSVFNSQFITGVNLNTGAVLPIQYNAGVDNRLRGLKADNNNNFVYAVRTRSPGFAIERAELLQWQLPGFSHQRTIINFSTAFSESTENIQDVRIYANNDYVYLQFNVYDVDDGGETTHVLRIPTSQPYTTAWQNFRIYVTNARNILKGISTDQYYMGFSGGSNWLMREDTASTSGFLTTNADTVLALPPYGVPTVKSPMIGNEFIWVADGYGRSIKRFSRLGSHENQYTVLPANSSFTFADWFAPPDWTSGSAPVATPGTLAAPTWQAPGMDEDDVSRPWNQPLTVRWNNNFTQGSLRLIEVQIRRYTLGGGGQEYLTFRSDDRVDWNPIATLHGSDGPWITWDQESMTWANPWQGDNAVRKYQIRVRASDNRKSEFSEFLIIRTTDTVTTTLNFDELMVAARLGSEGGLARYGVFTHDGDFTDYTTNRTSFGLFVDPTRQVVSKFSYGSGDTGYIYHLYGSVGDGYESTPSNSNLVVGRTSVEDSSINDESIYTVPSGIHSLNAMARYGSKAYTLEFNTTGNETMYIREHNLPSMTGSTIIYQGTPPNLTYTQWKEMTVSNDYIYLVRNIAGLPSQRIYRIRRDGSETSLSSWVVAQPGYNQIKAVNGYVYALNLQTNNIVRFDESSSNPTEQQIISGNFSMFRATDWYIWAYDSVDRDLYQFNIDGSNRELVHSGVGNELTRYFDVFVPDGWSPPTISSTRTLTEIDQMYVLYTYTNGQRGAIDYEGEEHVIADNAAVVSRSPGGGLHAPAFKYGHELYFATQNKIIATTDQAADALVERDAYVISNGRIAYPTRNPSRDSEFIFFIEITGPDTSANDQTLKWVRYTLPDMNPSSRVELAVSTNDNIFNYQSMYANDGFVYIPKWTGSTTTPIMRVAANGSGFSTGLQEWIPLPGSNSVTLLAAHNNYVYGTQAGTDRRVFRINTNGIPNPSTIISTANYQANADILVSPHHLWQVEPGGNEIFRYGLDGTLQNTYTPIAATENYGYAVALWNHEWEPGSVRTFDRTDISPITLNNVPDTSEVFRWEHPISTSLDWTIELRATLLNPDLSVKEDITKALVPEDCSIQYDVSRRIRSTAVLVTNREVDWFNHKVKLTMHITDNETGETRHGHLGVYIVETIQNSLDRNDEHITCQAYDLFSVMDTPIGFNYTIDENTTYPNAIRKVLDDMASWYGNQEAQPVSEYDPPIGVPYSVSYGSSAIPPFIIGSRVWLTSQSYTWLSVIETLAKEAGYRKPWINRDGIFVIDEAKDFSPNIVLPSGDYEVIDPEIDEVKDAWSQPNQWIMIAQTADPDVPLPSGNDTITTYVRTNKHVSESIGSYSERGRRLVRSVQSWATVAKTQTELDDKFERQARRIIEEEIQGGHRIKFKMVPNPGFWHNDIIQLPDVTGSDKWLVQKWSINFNGDNMNVEAIKVIDAWFGLD